MEVLIVLVFLSQIGLIIYFIKTFNAYKKNNFNVVNNELLRLDESFVNAIRNINGNFENFEHNTSGFLNDIKRSNNTFTSNQKVEFEKATHFIKTDYHSLTEFLKQNNDLLLQLLAKTQENIIKNTELKPILEKSHVELEGIFDKIKLLISSYEKNLSDVRAEVENCIVGIENTLEDKMKLISNKGEKSIGDALRLNVETISQVAEETNRGLKSLMSDNQIQNITNRMEALELEYKSNQQDLKNLIEKQVNDFAAKVSQIQNEKGKKGFLGFGS